MMLPGESLRSTLLPRSIKAFLLIRWLSFMEPCPYTEAGGDWRTPSDGVVWEA